MVASGCLPHPPPQHPFEAQIGSPALPAPAPARRLFARASPATDPTILPSRPTSQANPAPVAEVLSMFGCLRGARARTQPRGIGVAPCQNPTPPEKETANGHGGCKQRPEVDMIPQPKTRIQPGGRKGPEHKRRKRSTPQFKQPGAEIEPSVKRQKQNKFQ